MSSRDDFPKRTAACDRHGKYESLNYLGNVWSKCPACAETEANDRARKEAEAKARREAQRWQEQLGGSQIPERFRSRTLGSYVAKGKGQRYALEFATGYAADFEQAMKTGRSALFLGLPGTGKTHLAIGIALEVMERGHTALFMTAMRAIRRVKDTWNRDAKESETQAIRVLTQPDLLILDEIGVQHGSETEKNILFDVINERYEQCRPTILLSNLEVDEVKLYLGDRVFDRMREDGGEYVAFTWGSHRGN